jgi:hypothetical protein
LKRGCAGSDPSRTTLHTMFVSVCPCGTSARRGASHGGLLPWLVDAVLVLAGFETAGDFVELMSGGVRAAALDASIDAAAALACDLLVSLALALGVDDAPLDGHGAQVLALLAKLGPHYWAAALTCLAVGPVLLWWEWGDGRVTYILPGIRVGDTGGAPAGLDLPDAPPLAATNAADANSMNSSVQ